MVKLAVEVRDSDSRQPLADVMCRVVSPTGRLQSYKIADGKGHLSLTAGKADVLVFSLMGYGRRKVSVADLQQHGRQPAIILLSPKQIALKEVVVKLPPIRKQGDTLVYNVGSFLQKGDRHLRRCAQETTGNQGCRKRFGVLSRPCHQPVLYRRAGPHGKQLYPGNPQYASQCGA